jgi:hypothetical protein
MTSEELIKNTDIPRLSEEGRKIYEQIKARYESTHLGKFLAIDIKTQEAYLADSSAEAVEKARVAHPDTVFYVVKVGHSITEVMAGLTA